MSYRKKILYSQFFLIFMFVLGFLPVVHRLTHFLFLIESMDEFKRVLDIAIWTFALLLLLLNGILIMVVIHRVMRPVQQIIQAIRSYREGKEEFLPRIVLKERGGAIEFSHLASTLNSLTDQIQKQIHFLTHQKEETEEILESIGEGIVAVDPSARVTFANQAACQMLGLSKEQMMGSALDSIDVAGQDILKKCHELIVHALQTAEPAGHTWIVRAKGTFYHDLKAAPLAHKNGALLVLQDKTSDYRIVELGKDFIANASHELKTPITIIRGFAETLQDLPDLSKEMLEEITGKIVKTCGRLDKLVNSLLALTNIEQFSAKDFAKADLISVIRGCIETLLAVHPTAKVRLHSDVATAEVFADVALFELAVMNILENAVRYSQEPAKIDITIEATPTEYCVRFQDRGIGISEIDLPQIFERFYTVDKARSRKKGGSGLGLSIVKTVLEKHRGKVSVSSELGRGSLFSLHLPIEPIAKLFTE